MTEEFRFTQLNRRTFVAGTSVYLAAGINTRGLLATDDEKPSVRIGLVTDLHYADKKAAGSRHYRETLDKLEEAAAQFQQHKPEHMVELGDFIDAADSIATEKAYLKRIHGVFSKLPGKKHYVLGNHCVHTLTKQEFLRRLEAGRW